MYRNASAKGGWTIEVIESPSAVKVNLILKLAAINDSRNSAINMYFLGSTIERQLKLCYEISYRKEMYDTVYIPGGLDNFSSRPVRMISKRVAVHVQVKYRVVSKSHHIASNEHLLYVKDDSYFKRNYGPNFVYGANGIGETVMYLNEEAVRKIINGLDNNTISHELGHSLGLYHVDSKKNPHYWSPAKQKLDSTNVMFNGQSKYSNDLYSVDILPEQIDLIIYNYRNGRMNNH